MSRSKMLIVYCIILLTFGCSGSEQLIPSRDGDPQALSFGIALPELADIAPRTISETWSLTGGSFETDETIIQHVANDSGTGVFTPSWDVDGSPLPTDLAYAMYFFDLAGTESGRLLQATWETPPASGNMWIALANFAAGGWDWFATTLEDDLPIPELLPYSASNNSVFMLVLLTGTTECRLTQLEFVSEAPVAVLTAAPDPASDLVPFTVSFDATGSTSVNGDIADYEWDFNGNGNFTETANGEAAARGNATLQHTYTTALLAQAAVRVTDETGLSHRAMVSIAAAELMPMPDVEPYLVGDEELLTAIPLEVDGNPAVFLQVKTAGEFAGRLLYVRALDADGSIWGEPVELDFGEFYTPGYDLQPAIINEKPAAAYNIVPVGELCYVYALDAQGSSWGTPAEVMGGGDPQSLAVVGGIPALAGYDQMAAPKGLYFALATDASGTGWGTPVLVEENPEVILCQVGEFASIAEIAGQPAIGYSYKNEMTNPDETYEVHYIRATDATGTAWGTLVVIDHEEFGGINFDLGMDICLLPMDDTPLLFYIRQLRGTMGGIDEGDIFRVEAEDTLGTAWGVPVNVDDLLSKGSSTSGKVVSADGDEAARLRTLTWVDPTILPAGEEKPLTVSLSYYEPDNSWGVAFYDEGNPLLGEQEIYDYFTVADDVSNVELLDATISTLPSWDNERLIVYLVIALEITENDGTVRRMRYLRELCNYRAPD